jgi:hypothetical protein
VVQELLRLNDNSAWSGKVSADLSFPLAAEPHVEAWERYCAEAAEDEGLLQRIFPTLCLPIKAGISLEPAYRAVRGRGQLPTEPSEGVRLLAKPRLFIRASPAGPIPVVLTEHREDFVSLYRVVVGKNEPIPVPDSMGSATVKGFNNWDRIHQLKRAWTAEHGEDGWKAHFRTHVVPDKPAYQDTFILACTGPYSGVTAEALGLDPAVWDAASLEVRLAHECAHTLTRRVLGSMRDHLLDELLADYCGIVAAEGHFRADWFLHFMGLENPHAYRTGGRMENYLGDAPLSEAAFTLECALLREAAHALESLDHTHGPARRDLAGQAQMALAISQLSLEELAAGNEEPTSVGWFQPA